MRSTRYSKTFTDQIIDLIDYGVLRFGPRVAEEKKARILDTVERRLAGNPAIKRAGPRLGLTVYAITGTPFVVLYDFDDQELRLHFVFQRGADLMDLDPKSAEW